MAWNTPKAEDVIGMSADDLKKKFDSAVTKDDLSAALAPVEELKGSLAELKASLAQLTVSRETPPVPTTTPPENSDPTVSVLTDPTKFVSDATAGIRQQSLQTQADLNEMRARQNPKFARLFAKYNDEIMGFANKISLEQRAHPNFWEHHMRVVIGDKALKGEINSESYPTLLGGSSVGPNDDGDPDDVNMGFAPDMVQFFKSRNKDLKQMAFLRDRMSRDGDVINADTWKNRPH